VETLKQFLSSVYSRILKRSDSYLELGLALAGAEHVESVVGLSENLLYRRKFASIYETLREVALDEAMLLQANLGRLGCEWSELEGLAI